MAEAKHTPIAAEPLIHLQEDEEGGIAECGCELTHDDNGCAMIHMCLVHDAAPGLLAVCKVARDSMEYALEIEHPNSGEAHNLKARLTMINETIANAEGER